LDGGALGLSHPGVRRLRFFRGGDGVLAGPEEPGPPAGAASRRLARHPILVRRPRRRLHPLVPADPAAGDLPPESERPPAADPGDGRGFRRADRAGGATAGATTDTETRAGCSINGVCTMRRPAVSLLFATLLVAPSV